MSDRKDKEPCAEELLASFNRALPFSDEAEKGLLSCLLQDPRERLSDCRLTVPVEAFYHDANETVYGELLSMLDQGVPIDLVTLTNRLRDRDLLDKVGGAAAISVLFAFVPITSEFEHYKGIVLRKWHLRRLITGCSRSIHEAFEHGKEEESEAVDALVSRAQERMLALTLEQDAKDLFTHNELLMQAVDEVEEQMAHTAHILPNRVPCGLTEIDRMTGGFERGWLVVLAARPSMGKSALMENMYMRIALGQGDYKEFDHPAKPVLVVTLEMPAKSLVRRSLVGGAGLSLGAMRYGFKARGDQDKITQRMREIAPAKVFYLNASGLSIQRLRSRARILKAKHGIAAVFIDYLQLMTSDTRRAEQNRSIEIGEISRGLKAMGLELNLPVVALSQLNRSAEETKMAEPKLSQLREGGDIEQDADVVMMLHRRSYYDHEAPEHEATVDFAKGRDIGIGKVPLNFTAATTRFTSVTDSLFSNIPEHRQPGYQSKAQPSKQAGKSGGKGRHGGDEKWHDEFASGDEWKETTA